MTPAEVQIATENLPGSMVGLTIEVPSERVDQAFERVLSRFQQRLKIEGFRPGKAPRQMVRARLGEAALREEAIDLLVPEVVNQALRERSIDAIDTPRVEVAEFESGRPARLVAQVAVRPEVTLADLSTLSVPRAATVVDEAAVDARMEDLVGRLAEVEPVDREVRLGDVLVVDLDVTVDGAEVASERRRAMEVEVKDGILIPDLVRQLPGLKVGEEATAGITLPEDHESKEMAGKAARLAMTVRGVKERKVPELTDALAAQLSNGEHTDVASLRAAVGEDLREQARRRDQLETEQAVLSALVGGSQLEIPQALVEREVESRVHSLEHELAGQGLKLERYLEYVGRTREQMEEEMRPQAQESVKADLVLGRATEALGIAVDQDQVDAYMAQEAARDPELDLDRLKANPVARDYFEHRLVRLKTLESVVEKATSNAEAAPAKAKASAPARRPARREPQEGG